MPILNYRHQESPPCTCCGEATRSTTGTVDLGWDPAPVYIARWNPRVPAHGIALLIGLGDPRGFVAAKYALEPNAISVIGQEDYDWQSSNIQILDRNDVIDTPLATMAFRANKPHHPTASSRSVSMISRNYNLNPVLAFRCRY
jgi:hypothetical protein